MLTQTSLPPALALQFNSLLVRHGADWVVTAPLRDVTDPSAIASTFAAARPPGIAFVDLNQESDRLLRNFQNQATMLAIVGSLAILLLLLAGLRAPSRVLAVAAPLAAAVTITSAVLTSAGRNSPSSWSPVSCSSSPSARTTACSSSHAPNTPGKAACRRLHRAGKSLHRGGLWVAVDLPHPSAARYRPDGRDRHLSQPDLWRRAQHAGDERGAMSAPAEMIHCLHYPAPCGQADVLLDHAAGVGTEAGEFADQGMVAAVHARGLAVDIVVARPDLALYLEDGVTEALQREVVEPALARGCTRIWLLGISLGGMGALLYASAHEAQVEGLVLLAPFLAPGAPPQNWRGSAGCWPGLLNTPPPQYLNNGC